MNKGKICYVDVDDTLVRSVGSTRIPISHVIKKVTELKERGVIMYCWSSGGEDYARASAKEFGIEDCFAAFLPKPNILLDDQRIEDWTYLSQIHPNSINEL